MIPKFCIIDDLHHTLLTRLCSRGRLEAKLADAAYRGEDAALAELADVLLQPKTNHYIHPLRVSNEEEALFMRSATEFAMTDYELLLAHLQSTDTPYYSCLDMYAPDDALILPLRARYLTEITIENRTYSCRRSHYGNSSIQFDSVEEETTYRYAGFIEAIWETVIGGCLRTFIAVRLHRDLDEEDKQRTPFPQFPRLFTWAVEANQSDNVMIIEPTELVSHVAVYKRPAGTFGIDKPTLVLCGSLDRRRHPLKPH